MNGRNYTGKNAHSSMDVLDHGFVALRNISSHTRRIFNGYSDCIKDDNGDPVGIPRAFDADDIDPAQAARMSFGEMDTDRTLTDEMRLNDYLYRNRHTSPFEMVQVWMEVKLPIFIDRQVVRHRTWRRNESSGRYIVLPSDWYIPKIVGGHSPDKKQGQEDNLDLATQEWFRIILNNSCSRSYDHYLEAINRGVCKEHARSLLHLNHYVHWLGNVDLHNLFHFLSLRTHDHAQIEIRMYAWAMVDLIRPHLPGLISIFDKYCAHSKV